VEDLNELTVSRMPTC